jgi:hypothetical protein
MAREKAPNKSVRTRSADLHMTKKENPFPSYCRNLGTQSLGMHFPERTHCYGIYEKCKFPVRR